MVSVAHRRSGEYEEALAYARKAVELLADDPSAHLALAFSLAFGFDDDAGAAASYRRVLELDPDHFISANALAWILATAADSSLRDPSEAVRLAAHAVELEPAEALYQNTLGVARYRAGDWQGALSSLGRSMELQSSGGDPWDWFFAAMAHHRLNQHDQAFEFYDKSVDWIAAGNRVTSSEREEYERFRAEAAALLEIEEDDR